jgi:hypothetical protein
MFFSAIRMLWSKRHILAASAKSATSVFPDVITVI